MVQIDTTKMSSRGQVVIPLEMRKDIPEGEKLIIIRKGNDIILKKEGEVLSDWIDVDVFADENLLAEAWLSPEDDKAWKDL